VTDADAALYERAAEAAERAYAPYSRFQVGAAVRTVDGRVLEGVNVENVSYPLGVCAERAALACAVTEGYGPGRIEAVAVTASPCGGCRQWLLEFRVERVLYRNAAGDLVVATPRELLPNGFEF
jgi:cytidine deaminase